MINTAHEHTVYIYASKLIMWFFGTEANWNEIIATHTAQLSYLPNRMASSQLPTGVVFSQYSLLHHAQELSGMGLVGLS